MAPCEFYDDGAHHFVKGFWGLACERCGRISIHDPETDPPPREEELETTLIHDS